jgi:hypothetical protein
MAEYKPGDLFVGVIDFFGIIVPGAVLLYLRGDLILGYLGKPSIIPPDQVAYWVIFLIGAYLLGQILLGAGVPLNNLADIFSSAEKDGYYNEVKKDIDLPAAIKNRTNDFYRAFSFVRLNSERAIAEIERQAAEYKLFRSLSLVFLVDFLLSLSAGSIGMKRTLLSGLLCLISVWRFLFLLNWTRRLTFEFYSLLLKKRPENSSQAKTD